jgi:hypothetical protein
MPETVWDGSGEDTGSFLYWSVSLTWLRERRLAKQAANWTLVEGTVESCGRRGGDETTGAVLRYSYEFGGEVFAGVTMRDTLLNPAAASRLAAHAPGERIPVRVNPDNPGESYFPSGFGSLEPVVMGIISLAGSIAVLGIGIWIPAIAIAEILREP